MAPLLTPQSIAGGLLVGQFRSRVLSVGGAFVSIKLNPASISDAQSSIYPMRDRMIKRINHARSTPTLCLSESWPFFEAQLV